MKRNTLIRSAAWLLALCAVMPMAISCGDDSGKNPGTTTANKKETETIDENDPYADRLLVSDDLGEYDFGKYKYRIMSADGLGGDYFIEEDGADVIDSAVYRRNRAVEERFNCEIVLVGDPFYTEATHKIHVDITTGDDVFDLVASQIVALGGLVPENLFYNWHDLPNINFDKPWWSDSNEELLTHADVCYIAIGDLALSALKNTYCVFYNKRLGADYDMPDMFELVNNGEWTIDKITELSKDIYQDLNMDGKVDIESDLFGYVGDSGSSLNTYLWAFDNPVYQRNDDGELELVFHTDKLSALTSKLCDVFNIYTGIKQTKYTENRPLAMFREGRAMFINGVIDYALSCRDMEDDFSILPYPKWDEAQENYYTMVDGVHHALSIPKTIQNKEAVGTIIEALSAETYKQVVPVYYDLALKVKGARDEESIEMLDRIVASRVFDFGYMYDNFKGYSFLLQNQIARNHKNIESTVKRYSKSAPKWYNSVLEA
ncbi:MAG: hypothetical protein J6S76_03120, partial [Clostridia bacterium]|nr:hypothetical protein [Clostridia bacterium]